MIFAFASRPALQARARFGAPALAALFTLLAFSSPLSAQILTGMASDNFISGTAAGSGTTGTGATLATVTTDPAWAGRGGDSLHASVYVMVFQLPTLTAGQEINSATLTLFNSSTTGSGSLGANLDLYGLSFSVSSTVTTSQYYIGTNDTSATRLQQALFASGTTPSSNTSFSTNAGGSLNLAGYLNQQYLNGAVGGNYVFLRLNEDIFNTSARVQIDSGDDATHAPTISYTISSVPEPKGISLILLAGLALLVLRQRRAVALFHPV